MHSTCTPDLGPWVLDSGPHSTVAGGHSILPHPLYRTVHNVLYRTHNTVLTVLYCTVLFSTALTVLNERGVRLKGRLLGDGQGQSLKAH
jgi:hypothetical protein